MDYEPREGVDYMIDLYQVAAIPQDADQESVKRALNERLREYHPDRLQGLAPEFQRAGEQMARLLNRAKVVLLDDEKRSEYDQILSSWDGPVSENGTPVIRIDDALRAEAAQKTSAQLEAAFSEQSTAVAGMVKHNPKQQAMLGRMLEAADDGEDAAELRDAYDAAVFAEDQVLAIEEAERGRLLGLQENKRYETSLGYTDTVRAAIEGARVVQSEEHQRRVLGSVGIKLALLAGETPSQQPAAEVVSATGALPHYFDEQAKKIEDIATKREALLEKRLEIFQPTYPIAEAQIIGQPNFVIGVAKDADSDISKWIGFSFDADTVSLANTDVPEDVEELLRAGEYEQAYGRGYNILTFVMKDQIEIGTLLAEAYNKHLNKYFPEAMGNEE